MPPQLDEVRERIGDVAETLLSYFEHNKTFQTDRIVVVPAASYADPNLASAEIELIFKRLPLMLALSCEMANPGDYKAMEVVGQPVLLVRDQAGRVRAFLNVCAHRWAPVAAAGLGHCQRLRFVCPFHGWAFGVDGRLISVSERAKFGDVDKAKHGLKELPCEERHGMIFGCLTPETPLELDSYYRGLLDDFADFGLKDWTFLGSYVLDGPNWKLILTNFLESYHVAAQHPKTLAPYTVPSLNHYEGFGPHMRMGYAAPSIAKLREHPSAEWSRREGREFGIQRYFFPNTATNVAGSAEGEYSVVTQIFPGPTADRSRVVVLQFSKEPPGDEGARARREKEIHDILAREDFATGVATQQGLRSRAHEGFLYGRNERGPQYFHEWVDWYLEDNPHLPMPVI